MTVRFEGERGTASATWNNRQVFNGVKAFTETLPSHINLTGYKTFLENRRGVVEIPGIQVERNGIILLNEKSPNQQIRVPNSSFKNGIELSFMHYDDNGFRRISGKISPAPEPEKDPPLTGDFTI